MAGAFDLSTMDPKEKQKLYILFGIFGLAGLVFTFNLVLKPQFAKLGVMTAEYKKYKASVESAENLIKHEVSIRKQHEELKDQSGAYEQRLPAEDEISSLLEDFSKIADSTGVKILRIQPLERIRLKNVTEAQEDAPEMYSEFPILIEATAGYHQCGVFINKLEGADRFIKIGSFSIEGRKEDPRRHYVKLEVITYVMH